MPARSQLRRAILVSRTITFEDGLAVTFRYDRNKITDSWVDSWGEYERENDTGAINNVIADLVTGWDVFEDDEKTIPTPITAENVGDLFNWPDKRLILKELMSATTVSEDEKRGSSEPIASPSTGSTQESPTSPNGSGTSELQSASVSQSPT